MPGAEGNPGKTVSNKENNNDLIQQTKGKQRNYGTPEDSESRSKCSNYASSVFVIIM